MYVAMFGFLYNGRPLIRGQVIKELANAPNDPQLLSLNYLREVSSDEKKRIRRCDGCGLEFINDVSLYAHRRMRLCGASKEEILEKSHIKDKELIANLPEQKRSSITDLK